MTRQTIDGDSRSLTRDFSIRFAIIILIISALVFSISGLIFFKLEQSKFHQEAENLFQDFKKLIVTPLWHYDDVEIAAICQSFLSGGKVSKIVIKSTEDRQLFVFGDTENHMTESVVLSTGLYYKDKPIGKAEFYPKIPGYFSKNIFYFYTTIFAIFFISVSVAFASWRLLHSYVKRPLDQLLVWITKVQDGHYSGTQMEFPQKEISSVVHHFSLMVDSIKNREKQLKESESRLRLTFDHAPIGAAIVSLKGRFLQSNRELCRIVKYSADELKEMNIIDIIHPDMAGYMTAAIGQLRTGELEYHQDELLLVRKDGKNAWGRVSLRVILNEDGQPIHFLPMIENIDEQKKTQIEKQNLETRLVQTQKMEAIGTLAGGIAHDFNNILSAVIGYTEIALNIELPPDAPARKSLQNVLKAGLRAKDLVNQILTFSRQTEQELKPVEINIIVKEVAKLLRSSLPTTIQIKQNVLGNSLVMGDPTQIHQILLNLCTNAGHAMQAKGGVLTIELQVIDLKEDLVTDQIMLKPGNYVQLSVSDTGHGISNENLGRIFDPFFTTKERGEGTGMGLAVVHGIVQSYKGAINVYSEIGKGTTFNVFLPAIERRAEPDKRKMADIPKGSGHVLFVDDESAIVEIVTSQLESLGYKVTSCHNGLEALELMKTTPDRFDLVITDMTMPKMTGDELAKEIKNIRSETPIILCTGFSSKLTSEDEKLPDIDAILMKPIILRDMATIVRNVMERV